MRQQLKRDAVKGRSKAAVQLARIQSPQAEIATRVGTSRVAVSHWQTGKAKPDAAKRALLEEHYQIPAASWDEPAAPNATNAPSTSRRALVDDEDTDDVAARIESMAPRPTVRRETLDAPTSYADETIASKAARLERRIDALLDEVEGDASSLPAERARVLNTCVQSISLLAKIRGETPMTRARFFSTPEWRTIIEVFAEELREHPDVASRIAKRLRWLEAKDRE